MFLNLRKYFKAGSVLKELQWNFGHYKTNRAKSKDRDEEHHSLDGEVLEVSLLQDLGTLHLLLVPHTPPGPD